MFLVTGCSLPVTDKSYSECEEYYTPRLGLKYAKEVCKK